MSTITAPVDEVVIADAVRSPLGTVGSRGTVAGIRPAVLLAQTAWALLDRTLLEPAAVTRVVVAGGPRFARVAADACAHLGVTAGVRTDPGPGCSSGSVLPSAYRAVGRDDVVLVLATSGSARDLPDVRGRLADAERIAARWGLRREDLDGYARLSRRRAREVAEMGEFAPEIIPAVAWSTRSRAVVVADETIGADDRACHVSTDGLLHPGNVSAPAVGAAATLLLGADRALELGVLPRARVLALAESRGDAATRECGPLSASRAVLRRSGLDPNDLDHYEVDETCPAVPLAWCRAFDADLDRFNPRSGSIGLGDPGPASALRSLATTLSALDATGGRLGLHASSGPGGAGDALLLEYLPRSCCSHEVLGAGLARPVAGVMRGER